MSYSLMKKDYIETFDVGVENITTTGVPYFGLRVGNTCFFYGMFDFTVEEYAKITLPDSCAIDTDENPIGQSIAATVPLNDETIVFYATIIDANTLSLTKSPVGTRVNIIMSWKTV